MNRNKTGLPLDMQLFAEEAGGQNEQQAETSDTAEGAAGAGETVPSFDELLEKNKAYQLAFDKKIGKALDTAKAKWEQEAAAQAGEAKKLEKMSAEERARYELDREKSKLEKEKAAFAKQQLETAVGSELLQRGFNADFAKFLTGHDADSSKANIEAFETAFKDAVAAATAQAMRGPGAPPAAKNKGDAGAPPKDFRAYEAWRKKNI